MSTPEHNIDWEQVRKALTLVESAIDPTTLPRGHETRQQVVRPSLIDGYELTDAEWQVLQPLMPLPPVPQPKIDNGDRAFLVACLFRQRGKHRQLGWAAVPGGKGNSHRGRFRRWSELGYFNALYEAVRTDERLSEARRADLRAFAEEAERLCERVEEARRQRRA